MLYADFFLQTFLFRGIEPSSVNAAIEGKIVMREFSKGDIIYSKTDYESMIGFIYEGECEVRSSEGSVPLNSLGKYSSFGITAVFSSENEFPTIVYAKKASKILFITRGDLFDMMNICPDVSKNIILFLIERITFLNKKVGTFSSVSVKKKLAKYLIEEHKRLKTNTLVLNVKRTAEAVSAGRASLYRALSALEDKGLIKKDEKTIILINPKGLERI